MLDAFLGLVGIVFGWLGGLLPDSPFADAVTVTDDLRLGLAWLNWIFPVSEALLMLVAWIAAMAAVTAVKIALRVTSDVGGKVAGN